MPKSLADRQRALEGKRLRLREAWERRVKQLESAANKLAVKHAREEAALHAKHDRQISVLVKKQDREMAALYKKYDLDPPGGERDADSAIFLRFVPGDGWDGRYGNGPARDLGSWRVAPNSRLMRVWDAFNHRNRSHPEWRWFRVDADGRIVEESRR